MNSFTSSLGLIASSLVLFGCGGSSEPPSRMVAQIASFVAQEGSAGFITGYARLSQAQAQQAEVARLRALGVVPETSACTNPVSSNVAYAGGDVPLYLVIEVPASQVKPAQAAGYSEFSSQSGLEPPAACRS